jgi:hypothetical protein
MACGCERGSDWGSVAYRGRAVVAESHWVVSGVGDTERVFGCPQRSVRECGLIVLCDAGIALFRDQFAKSGKLNVIVLALCGCSPDSSRVSYRIGALRNRPETAERPGADRPGA